MTGRRARTTGQALAEFAFVLPIFLLIALALFDIGRGVFIYNGLTNAAREGARLAVVNQYESDVVARTQDMAFGTTVDPTGLVGYYKAQPNTDDVVANGTCDPIAVGCIAVVTAKTSWTPITPIIGNLIGPIDLEARSELAIELVCPNTKFAAYATHDLCPKQP